MSHRSAPLTPAGRLRLVRRCQRRPIEHGAAEAGVSRQCLSRWVWLVRLGLNRRRWLDVDGEPLRTPGKITARYRGHLVHANVKKVGRIPDGGGWRVHGRASLQHRAAGRAETAGARAGYVCPHSAVDGYSSAALRRAPARRDRRHRCRVRGPRGPGSPPTASPPSPGSSSTTVPPTGPPRSPAPSPTPAATSGPGRSP